MFASHPMPFGHMSLSAFYPGTAHGSIWDDDDVFDLMYSHMGGAMGTQVGSCRGPACSRSRAQQRQEALRMRAEKARREEQRRIQQQKRIEEERRRVLEQRRKRIASKHAKILVLEDDPEDHITIGVILNRAVSPENLSIEPKKNTLKISQYKRTPIYQYGRDIWGMPVAQHQLYRKDEVWSEMLAIDPSVNVLEYCAQLQDNVLVITMPYHSKKVSKSENVLRVPIESDDDMHPADDDMQRIPIEDDEEQPTISEEEVVPHDTPRDTEEPKVKDNETISSVHDVDEEGMDGPQETQSPKSIQDIWEDMDGSIEDCEY
mmetsp:Transcript_12885/g.25787  ORF Transcript_12885/g.25787 Transcript_12885/m.25787 type:complete len:318 (-) Transcript_12885:22-975(-)